jgi:lipopolysaccharide/colanic/teichoic acid biosynthesis glycosyltransferase
MSLAGPRPLVVEEDERITGRDPAPSASDAGLRALGKFLALPRAANPLDGKARLHARRQLAALEDMFILDADCWHDGRESGSVRHVSVS